GPSPESPAHASRRADGYHESAASARKLLVTPSEDRRRTAPLAFRNSVASPRERQGLDRDTSGFRRALPAPWSRGPRGGRRRSRSARGRGGPRLRRLFREPRTSADQAPASRP